MNTTVVIGSKEAFGVSINLPEGKPLELKWNDKNGFQVEVPVELKHRYQLSGKVETLMSNLPQHLLDSYPCLHLKEIKEQPLISHPVIVNHTAETPAAEAGVEAKRKPGRPRKEDTKEETNEKEAAV